MATIPQQKELFQILESLKNGSVGIHKANDDILFLFNGNYPHTDMQKALNWWECISGKGLMCFDKFGHYNYLRVSNSDILEFWKLNQPIKTE